MSPKAEQLVLSKELRTRTIPLWESLLLLKLKKSVITERRADSLDLKICHELRMIEINKCLPILAQLEEM